MEDLEIEIRNHTIGAEPGWYLVQAGLYENEVTTHIANRIIGWHTRFESSFNNPDHAEAEGIYQFDAGIFGSGATPISGDYCYVFRPDWDKDCYILTKEEYESLLEPGRSPNIT